MKLNKLFKPTTRSTKPATPAVKPGDRRLSLTRRGPIWRRGTLVLIA